MINLFYTETMLPFGKMPRPLRSKIIDLGSKAVVEEGSQSVYHTAVKLPYSMKSEEQQTEIRALGLKAVIKEEDASMFFKLQTHLLFAELSIWPLEVAQNERRKKRGAAKSQGLLQVSEERTKRIKFSRLVEGSCNFLAYFHAFLTDFLFR